MSDFTVDLDFAPSGLLVETELHGNVQVNAFGSNYSARQATVQIEVEYPGYDGCSHEIELTLADLDALRAAVVESTQRFVELRRESRRNRA